MELFELFESLKKEGKEELNIEIEPELPKVELKQWIITILDWEHSFRINIKKLPMCFFENAFDHLDNNKSSSKVKGFSCVKCKFNFFCNGYYKEMESYVKPLVDMPKEIVIELTHRCNLHCNFCFNQLCMRESSEELNTEQLKLIIAKIAQLGICIVRFTGGEPFLRLDFIELVKYAKDQGLQVWLNTNGTIANEATNQAAKLIDNVLISLAGFDRESDYKVTRLKKSFENKLKTIEIMKSHGVTVRAGIVLTEPNIANIERFFKLTESLGIRFVEFYRPVSLKLNAESMIRAIRVIFELNKKYRVNHKIANAIPFCIYKPEISSRVSLGGLYDDGASRMVVSTNGRIKPAYYLELEMGNALHDDLLRVWNSKKWRNLRELKYVPKNCKNCKWVYVCRGGSRSLAKIASGNLRGKDPLLKL